MSGTGERAQQAKCMFCKHEAMSLITRTNVKAQASAEGMAQPVTFLPHKQAFMSGSCNPSSGKTETGRSLGLSLVRQHNLLVSSRPIRGPIQNKGDGIQPKVVL